MEDNSCRVTSSMDGMVNTKTRINMRKTDLTTRTFAEREFEERVILSVECRRARAIQQDAEDIRSRKEQSGSFAEMAHSMLAAI